MMKQSPHDTPVVTLAIEKLVPGGAGLGRHEGKACFIDGALPGETVLARITQQRSQYFNAQLCDILESSPWRIQPACPVAGLCGGCQWQHLAYGQQLSCKAAILDDCLNRIGKLHHLEPLPPLASPLQTRYRSRAGFKISGGRKPKIGFFENKTHSVVEIHDCLLLEPRLLEALQICRGLLQQKQTYAGFTDLQLLAIDSSPHVLGLWHGSRHRRNINCTINTVTGALEQQHTPAQDVVLGMRCLRNTDNFYQVNRLQNQAMIGRVLEYFSPVSGSAILDMFCGCGNFSLFLAEKGARVTGIDANKAAIDEARQNARMNGLENTRFMTGNIHRLDESMLEGTYDGILLNPPRSGCEGRTLEQLAAKAPAVIVYVSCNPATLARDLRQLLDSGYAVDEVQPFDMFPQTYHVETIVKLSGQERDAR